MKQLISFILLLFCSTTLLAQDSTRLLKTLAVVAQSVEVDKLGDIYLLTENEIIKYNSKLEKTATFSNPILGKINTIDVSDPLKVLVFFQETSQIVFLDNTLSQQSDIIQLAELEMEEASLSCSSYDNGFWVYDSQLAELIRVNQRLTINQRSGNIIQLTGQSIEPIQLFENYSTIYLIDKKAGILLFDKFGTYLKTLAFKGKTSIQVVENKLVYQEQSSLKTYHLKTFQEGAILLPKGDIVDWKIFKNQLYVLNDKALQVFTLHP